MYIKTIDIQNYRGIEKLHVAFKEGVNLLIGNNGAGKTSLLNSLAIMLQEPLQMISGLAKDTVRLEDVYQTTAAIGDTVVQTDRHFPVKVESTVIWNKKKYQSGRKKASESTNSESMYYDLASIFNSKIGDKDTLFPILCFFPAQRGKLKIEKENNLQFSSGEPQRSQGYRNAFSDMHNMKAVQQWCLQMEFAEYQKKQKIREYKKFQTIVSHFCSVIDDHASNPKIYYSSEKTALVYFDGREEKEISQLSDGYQAVLSLVIELAYRAVLLNPMAEDLANTINGVVLIDEIEMHLHPAWQWKILDALRQTFPKVQFIIATHAPIILSSAREATIFLMKSPNEVKELNNVYGYSVDDVLSLPQGTMSQPARIKEYYDRVEDILETGAEEELNKMIETAKNELKNSPAVLKGLLDFIEINRWVKDA